MLEGDCSYTVPDIDWDSGATPAVGRALEAMRAAIKQEYAVLQGVVQRDHLFSDQHFDRLRECVMAPGPVFHRINPGVIVYHLHDHVVRFATAPGVTPVALLKLTSHLMAGERRTGIDYQVVEAFNAMHVASGKPSLLELERMLSVMGHGPDAMLSSFCAGDGFLGRGWSAQALWPFFARNIALLNQRLRAVSNNEYGFERRHLYRAIKLLPEVPASIIDTLFELALGSAKTERAAAQQALADYAGRDARIIAALASGKGEVRTAAGQWLAQLGHQGALEALERALGKEKNDVAKGAMLDALVKIGHPVAKYVDRARLLTEARKALAKGIPKELAWFPWATLPGVHWADSGEAVDGDLLRFMLAQAVRQKSPEPNGVLRQLCGMFAPPDRERFGQFVLEAWITEDTIPITREQAERAALANAQSMHAMMLQMPQYFQGSALVGRSVEEIRASYLPDLLLHPVGTAIASKGMLAVAAACAAERAADTAGRYLKRFYGNRAAHGRALIAMLAWIDHPAATQLVLSVGNRFRTKSFQEEATRQIIALAERKGWTIGELADRTMPAAGFDEAGALELDFGARTFTARLQADFKVALFNQDGAALSALPEPRMDDDAGLAESAKKALGNAKKEIKVIVKAQSERLYEALCIERDWAFDEWQRYLFAHPVVRHLVQRLVWVRYEDGAALCSFRPLDDGTLSDAFESEVSVPPQARVRIAHDSIMEKDAAAAWLQHMIDYEILPLFQQFGKGSYVVPPDKAKAASIDEFEGYLIDSFALRGRAVQLGYTRGPTEDGGRFSVYEKRFTTLGIVARIEFTGSQMPEKSCTVALLNLAFGGDLALADLPAILLSECYNDLRILAETGSGFDPQWQQKVDY